MRLINIVRIIAAITVIASIAWFVWPSLGPPRLIDKYPSESEIWILTVVDLFGGLSVIFLIIDALNALSRWVTKRVAKRGK